MESDVLGGQPDHRPYPFLHLHSGRGLAPRGRAGLKAHRPPVWTEEAANGKGTSGEELTVFWVWGWGRPLHQVSKHQEKAPLTRGADAGGGDPP